MLSNNKNDIADVDVNQLQYHQFDELVYLCHKHKKRYPVVAVSTVSLTNLISYKTHYLRILTLYKKADALCHSYCIELDLEINSKRTILSSINGLLDCMVSYYTEMSKVVYDDKFDILHTRNQNHEYNEAFDYITANYLGKLFHPVDMQYDAKERGIIRISHFSVNTLRSKKA